MLRNIFWKTLRDNRRGLFWWSLGLIAFMFVNVVFYPDFKDQTQFNDLLKSDAMKALVGNIKDFTSAEGYMNAQWFSLMAPLLLIIYAVGQGVGLIAGEESRRTLPLLLATPISRERVIRGKFAALIAGTAFLAIIQMVALAVLGPMFELNLNFWHLASVSTSLFLVSLLFGSLGFLLGAARGNRSLGVGVTVSFASAAYLLNTLAPLVKDLQPYQKYSPFYWYYGNDPLLNGLDWSYVGIMAVVTLVLFAASVLVFRRRDIAA